MFSTLLRTQLIFFFYFLKNFSLPEPPSFVEKIQNVTTVLGTVAEFKCVVKGSPPLTIQWQKDETWILEDAKIERTFENNVATLRIPICQSNHSGRYTCQALNEAGHEKCFATLLIQGWLFIYVFKHVFKLSVEF